MTTLEREEGGVWVLRMRSGAVDGKGHATNAFTPALLLELGSLLDRILADAAGDEACALVVAGGSKFFSNGHDVQWLEAAAGGPDSGPEASAFIDDFYRLILRFLTLPVPTVAAVTGHAFAGGCLLAMAQDFRVMRGDRGFMCMNEVDMALMVTPEQAAASHVKPGAFKDADAKMMAVMQAKLPASTVRQVFLSGKRYGGAAALELGLVDAVADDEAATVQAAVDMARAFAPKGARRNRRAVGVLKTEMVRRFVPLLSGL